MKQTTETARRVVLHLTRSHIGLMIIETDPVDRTKEEGRWKRVPWPGTSSGLPAADDPQKLTTLLKEIVEQEKLTGQSVSIALGGDFCVTRVVTGQNQRVEQELQQLALRSERYLSLGTGPKAQVIANYSFDTRRKLAWMTIVNQRTLETLLQSIQDAGLKVQRIEHSLIGLSRAAGLSLLDDRSPVILVEVGERGVDFGVSYQGRLLLDYRPGGLTAQDHILDTLKLHLDRIQRYCNRQMQFKESKINRVLLCGEPVAIEGALQQFADQDKLRAEAFCPQEVPGNWQWANSQWPSASLSPAMGTLLADTVDTSGPDLMDHVRQMSREPLLPLLLKTCWPIAACLLLLLGLSGYNTWREIEIAGLEEQAKLNGGQDTELRGLQHHLKNHKAELQSLRNLESALSNSKWHELLANIGGCLPSGVWLENLKVDRDRSILLNGPSFTEDGVYEFVRHLKTVPGLKNVDLEGTRPARLNSGPATLFDIRGKIDNQVDSDEGVKHAK